MDCQKCSFYKPGNYVQTGTCLRYIAYRGRGKLVYEFAAQVRADKSKCGPSARLFIHKETGKNVQSERYRNLLEDDE
jgi:hypothetical protein